MEFQDKDRLNLYRGMNKETFKEKAKGYQRNLKKNLFLIKKWGAIKVYDFSKHKVLVIGAGVSLEDNIEFLKKYYSNFIIIAADMSLRPLLKHGIKPQFVISAETYPGDFWNGLDTTGINLLAFSCMANLRTWKGNIGFYNYHSTTNEYNFLWKQIGKLPELISGGNIISMAVAYAIGCKAEMIILIGNDLGYTDRYYTKECYRYQDQVRQVDRFNSIENQDSKLVRRNRKIWYDRNGVNIYMTGAFVVAKEWMEQLIKNYKNIYDTSPFGLSELYVTKLKLKT